MASMFFLILVQIRNCNLSKKHFVSTCECDKTYLVLTTEGSPVELPKLLCAGAFLSLTIHTSQSDV